MASTELLRNICECLAEGCASVASGRSGSFKKIRAHSSNFLGSQRKTNDFEDV